MLPNKGVNPNLHIKIVDLRSAIVNGSDVRRQSNMVVYNVHSYLKELVSSKPNATVKEELLSQRQKVTADACGVSCRRVQRSCAEADMTAAAEVLNNSRVTQEK
ncbi:hypothetical protein AVEN_183285-1 [Araneus ventricosus]|uniref:Uncharacterized protein n=1 Tax=Araneus ventricosus TaxID=182803 RepID=A0A4Y2EUN0_ARAVE|nr:hypothetical protein AVEN_183285-1 [Araneus ventricosus]